MARAVTEYQAFGVYRDEAVTSKALQFLRLKGTAANTDTAFDLGTYAGSFWTDAADAIGAAALKVIRDIETRAQQFVSVGGLGVNGKALQDASRAGAITKLDSAASVGGAAVETLTVTGLLTTDTILAVTPFQQAGTPANTPVIDYGDANGAVAVAGQLPVEFLGNPGAGAKVRVAVLRTTQTTPDAGGYQLAMDGTNTKLPNLTFASGDAPTAFELVLCWLLKDGEQPVLAAS